MSYSTIHKGKRPADRHYPHDKALEPPSIPPSAYIQAYEAQLVYGKNDVAVEQALKAEHLPESSRSRGRGLLRWHGSDEDHQVWAERHDIIHLLTELPPLSNMARSPSPTHSSSSSWDSLPSDTDETFHITSAEQLDEYERKKKQQWINALREDRLREREEQDRAQAVEDGRALSHTDWDPKEQPSEAILTLMRHTAKSLSDSPDPGILELRILANHAKDDRFSFLRGRYSSTWEGIKQHVRQAKMSDPKRKVKEEKAVGALLGGYESSDEDEDDETDVPPPPPPEEDERPPTPPPLADSIHQTASSAISGEPEPSEEEIKQSERRQRAEEWKRKRAETKSQST